MPRDKTPPLTHHAVWVEKRRGGRLISTDCAFSIRVRFRIFGIQRQALARLPGIRMTVA